MVVITHDRISANVDAEYPGLSGAGTSAIAKGKIRLDAGNSIK
jgi:hypothetical protein